MRIFLFMSERERAFRDETLYSSIGLDKPYRSLCVFVKQAQHPQQWSLVMIFSDENCTISNIMQWCFYRVHKEYFPKTPIASVCGALWEMVFAFHRKLCVREWDFVVSRHRCWQKHSITVSLCFMRPKLHHRMKCRTTVQALREGISWFTCLIFDLIWTFIRG